MITDDSHIHTNFSPDAPRDVFPEVQIQEAIRRGLKSMCFTDHYDEGLKAFTRDETAETKGTLPYIPDVEKYFETLLPLKEKYRDRIDIGIGMEFGMTPQTGAFYDALAEKYPFDFIINSTHWFCGIDPCHDKTGFCDQALYEMCFKEMIKNVQACAHYDVCGHIDYVVRYGKMREKAYHPSDMRDVIDEILKSIIAQGKGLELNTAGLKYGLPFAHPAPFILKRYKALGGTILTVGSDGHMPGHLAWEFDKVPEILEACGFKYYTVFRNHKPRFIHI